LEEGLHEARADHTDGDSQQDRERHQDIAAHLLLGRLGANLPLQPDAIADGIADGVQRLCQVAAQFELDIDDAHKQINLIAAHAVGHIAHRLLQGYAQLHGPLHAHILRPGRLRRLIRHHGQGLRKAVTGAQSAGQ